MAKLLITHSFRLRNLVQQLLCEIRELLDFAEHHPMRELRKLALAETVAYIRENMSTAMGVYTKIEFLNVALKHVCVDGHYVEFGVWHGGSIRHIAARLRNKSVIGFDSFQGLPDDWVGRDIEKGTFSLGGRLPKVPSNVTLEPGWFHHSVPQWLDLNPGALAFIHIDCDLYTSTKTIFDLISPRIVKGTVIAFDEYFGYPNWKNHEFKAFQEYVEKNQVSYEYLAFARKQAAVRITGGCRTA